MTDEIEILQMNIKHFEGLLRLTQDEDKRLQVEKLLAETKAELRSTLRSPLPRR
jgi:hypothetical protein